MAWLSAWLPTRAATGLPPPTALDKQLKQVSAAYEGDVKHLLDKALTKNRELETKVTELEDEVKMRKALAQVGEEEVKLARKELGDKDAYPLVTAIFDFTSDMFASPMFKRGPKSGLLAAADLRTRIRQNLPQGVLAEKAVIQVLIFFNDKAGLVYDLLAEGVIRAPGDLDVFIASFNTALPLFLLIETRVPPSVHLNRLRALAVQTSRHPHLCLLILGRWALDAQLFSLLAPLSSDLPSQLPKLVKIPSNIAFLPPFKGQWLAPELSRREPKVAELRGVLRSEAPLIRGRGAYGPAKLNYNLPAYAQQPPICLPHHLLPEGCAKERCGACHAYQIPPDQLRMIAHEVQNTPCPYVRRGEKCREGKQCVFQHEAVLESVWREPQPMPAKEPRKPPPKGPFTPFGGGLGGLRKPPMAEPPITTQDFSEGLSKELLANTPLPKDPPSQPAVLVDPLSTGPPPAPAPIVAHFGGSPAMSPQKQSILAQFQAMRAANRQSSAMSPLLRPIPPKPADAVPLAQTTSDPAPLTAKAPAAKDLPGFEEGVSAGVEQQGAGSEGMDGFLAQFNVGAEEDFLGEGGGEEGVWPGMDGAGEEEVLDGEGAYEEGTEWEGDGSQWGGPSEQIDHEGKLRRETKVV